MATASDWPKLEIDGWTDTRETLHMWLQIVGKVQMVSTALINHWWNVTFEISARGLRTRLMRTPSSNGFDAEFDFIDHVLLVRDTLGNRQTVTLEPKTVAEFWAQVQQALAHLSIEPVIVPVPNEVADAVPFAEDTEHKTYDATAVNTFWRQLLTIERVFADWRAGFAGKDSPVQVFWGSMDLSCVRFSGRDAPPHTGSVPNCPPWVMAEAESRENSAAGFWPGGSAEGTFYAYAYPEPEGYRDTTLTAGTFDDNVGEWVLPYEQVRTSSDPGATLRTFLDETYVAAAVKGNWDRALFDVNPHRLDKHIYHGDDPTR